MKSVGAGFSGLMKIVHHCRMKRHEIAFYLLKCLGGYGVRIHALPELKNYMTLRVRKEYRKRDAPSAKSDVASFVNA